MYRYRMPGVYFEWLDPPSGIRLLRTDIAGFVGIAGRGPLHQPVRVESLTQFTSMFGDPIPQSYMAYAVQGFFANGGVTCYVVRVADPESALASSLTLADTTGQHTLLLTARSPGVWGRKVQVSLVTVGANRFSLTLRIPGGVQEMWQDMTMAPAHVDLVDEFGRSVIRLTVSDPREWQPDVRLSVNYDEQAGLSITFYWPDDREESWHNLSLSTGDPRYFETVLNDPSNGSRLVVADDLRPPDPSERKTPKWLSVAPGRAYREAQFTPDPRYLETVLNDPSNGSRLVMATNLFSPARFPANTPVRPSAAPKAGWYQLQPGQQAVIPDDNGRPVLRLTAANSINGWVGVTVDQTGLDLFRMEVYDQSGKKLHSWEDLMLRPGAERTVETVVNQADHMIRADRPDGLYLLTANGPWPLQGGQDGLLTLSPDDVEQGLAALEVVDEVSILAIPDLIIQRDPLPEDPSQPVPCDLPERDPNLHTGQVVELEYPPVFSKEEVVFLQGKMIAQCENLKDRVAILDMPPDINDVQAALAWRTAFDSKYAALYFPWLKMPDPLRLGGEVLREVPPSGHVAGVYARGDQRIGVHKPPANEALEGVQDVTETLDNIAHGMLNERSVNVIRPYPGRGVRVFGARTLSSDASWRFVNVRRLMIMIEEAIDEQMQWLVFENNLPDLWREVGRVVRSFLDDLWQRGMLDGSTAEEAYTVTCDETTNPPQETDLGRLTCQIGVLPPWPAEFVVVRIGKTEYGTQIIET